MTGHERLVHDLMILLAEAVEYEFHDFKNTKHAMPKIALHHHLLRLDRQMQEGAYDNEPDADDEINLSELLKGLVKPAS